jgi:hypothetical protein
VLEFPGAVADGFRTHTHPVQQGEKQVRHRLGMGEGTVPSAHQAPVSSAYEKNRQIFIRVTHAVGNAAAVNSQCDRQSSIAIWD